MTLQLQQHRSSARSHVITAAGNRSGMSISPIARKAQRQAANLRIAQRQTPNESITIQQPQSVSTPSPAAPTPSASLAGQSPSYDILEAFFYGRAFAITLSKRLGEVVIDAVAEISKAAAERPQRMQEFQEEVRMLAQKEMAAAAVPQRAGSSADTTWTSSASSSSGGSGSSSSGAMSGMRAQQQPQDMQAVVDDLRAEIAYSRAILQQIRTGGKSGMPPGPPPPLSSSITTTSSSGITTTVSSSTTFNNNGNSNNN